MTPEENARYVIHYKPSEEVREKISELQHLLIDEEKLTNIPAMHVTVFAFDSYLHLERNIAEIFSKIEYLQPQIILNQIDLFHKGILVVKIDKNKNLIKNHNLSLDNFVKYVLHDSDFVKKIGEMPMTLNQQNTYNRFGSPFYGQLYNPHISLGKIILNNTNNTKKINNTLDTNTNNITKYINFFSHNSWLAEEIYLSKKVSKEWIELEKIKI